MSATAEFRFAQSVGTPRLKPRPVAVWPSGPLEVFAAFAAPIDQSLAQSFVGKEVSFSEDESSKPVGSIRIAGAQLTDAGRTLILATEPHPRAARYVLPIRDVDDAKVTYDLSGVEATWSEGDNPADAPRWSGWWPRLDSESLRLLGRTSKPHDEATALLSRRGRLVLSALLRLPRGTVRLRLEGNAPIDEAIIGDVQSEPAGPASKARNHIVTLTVESAGDPLFLTATLRTGTDDRPFRFAASYRVGDETTDHALGAGQLMLPWVPITLDPASAAPLVIPDLAGGDPARGKAIFAGDQARCSQCHAFRGQGGRIGPDLTDIGSKGRAEIYRSIAVPSAAIEPAYTSYTIATKDGQIVVGVVRAEGFDTIKVTDTNAHVTIVLRKQVEQIRPSATSIMPVGLTGALGSDSVRDVISYLTSPSIPPPDAKPQR